MSAAASPSTWKAAIAALLLFALADVALFRSGLYGWIAKPDSSAGWITLRTQFDEAMLARREPTIAVFGDSRVGEGCSAELMQDLWPDHAVTVRTMHAPGSSPRVQAHLLEALDPRGGRFALAVFALADFDDRDQIEDMQDRTLDLPFLAPMLGLSEALDVAADFDDPAGRREAQWTAWCKAYAWRRDVQDFAADPYARYLDVRHRFGAYRWGRRYQGRDGSLAGVRLDGDRVVGVPANADPMVATWIRHLALDDPPPDQGRMLAYRRSWLGRIVAHEAGTGTQVVFVRLPTQVLPRRKRLPPYSPVLDELAQRPHVHVLPRDLLADLERPEFFYDHLHLNAEGRRLLTEILTRALVERFGDKLGR